MQKIYIFHEAPKSAAGLLLTQRRTFAVLPIEPRENEPVKVAIGISVCSKKDVFSRKMGRTIASGRALKGSDDLQAIVNAPVGTHEFVKAVRKVLDERFGFRFRQAV